jgi:hypothetical protein
MYKKKLWKNPNFGKNLEPTKQRYSKTDRVNMSYLNEVGKKVVNFSRK